MNVSNYVNDFKIITSNKPHKMADYHYFIMCCDVTK